MKVNDLKGDATIGQKVTVTMSNTVEDMVKLLRSLDLKDVSNVPNKNIKTPARISKILDGDTIKVVTYLGQIPFSFSIRVNGIDAPESTLRDKKTTLLQKEAGLLVKAYVIELFKDHDCPDIILYDLDKYGGRYMGDLFLKSGCSLSKHLIEKKYVKAYDGGTKDEWKECELNAIVEQLGHLKKK